MFYSFRVLFYCTHVLTFNMMHNTYYSLQLHVSATRYNVTTENSTITHSIHVECPNLGIS